MLYGADVFGYIHPSNFENKIKKEHSKLVWGSTTLL